MPGTGFNRGFGGDGQGTVRAQPGHQLQRSARRALLRIRRLAHRSSDGGQHFYGVEREWVLRDWERAAFTLHPGKALPQLLPLLLLSHNDT